jgi:acetyl-CoA carboxylase biotin carboxyl carrier protein
VVTEVPEGRPLGRRPVDASTTLVVLDPEAATGARAAGAVAQAHGEASGPVFRTPLGGRYYARPAPDAPLFVQAGAELRAGPTVALIEVMKTFNRVSYGGPGVPERARVKRVVPKDGDDVEPGDVLLELEAAEG